MTVLPNTGLTLPTRGAPGSGAWADTIDADLALVDAHDHSAGKGARVPTSGVNINADLTFSSLYAPINLHRITFASIVALSSSNKSLFVSNADNELYWRSNTGANVKLTSGSALNIAAFTGGIGGDYATVSALVDYDDATDTYRFRQETSAAVRQFAKVKFADIILTEYDAAGDATVPTNSVTLKSPDALAGNYSLTLPAALPGSTQIVQIDSSGVLTASNTVANAVTLSGGIANNVTLTLGATASALITANAGITVATGQAVTLSGTASLTAGGLITANAGITVATAQAVTLSGTATLTSGGLITANAGVTAGANQHVTVSGTGKFKYGTTTLSNPGSAFVRTNGTGSPVISGRLDLSGAAGSASMPIDLSVGARVTAVRVFIQDSGVGPTKLTASFRSVTSTGATTTIASSAESSGASTNQTLTISPAATTLVASTFYHVVILITTGTDSTIIWGCEVDYDQP